MNILLLMSDDHRADAMGCMGDARVETPFLDRLAGEGCHLRGARIMGGHSPAVCVPSRACLFSGRHCYSAYDRSVSVGTIPTAKVLLGEHLRQQGWACFHTGKWHLDHRSLNRCFDQGRAMFVGGMHDHYRIPLHDWRADGDYRKDSAYVDGRHSTEVFVDAAMRFLDGRRGSTQPFFLSCCFTSPHDPRTAPPDWHARFPVESIPLPANYLDEHPFDNGELRIRDENLAAHPRTPAEVRRHIADYYAMIAHQDHHMGRLVDHLDRLGLGSQTLVIYTGDHGLAVGMHGLMGKQNCYEHALRIPLILRGPDIPAGSVRRALCHGYDLFPTICDLAGIATPPGLDGVSRRALIDGDEDGGVAWSYGVYMDAMASITDGRRKLIRTYVRGDGRGSDRTQVFDLDRDPWELHDRSEDPAYAGLRADLEEHLLARQRELGDPLAQRPR